MNRRVAMAVVTASVLCTVAVPAQDKLPATFFPEPPGQVEEAAPAPPSFAGKVLVRDPSGAWVPRRAVVAPLGRAAPSFPPAPGGDLFIKDGSETSLAINYGDGDNLVAAYNEGFDFNPDVPHANSTNGNGSWTPRSFPNGSGTFTGSPFDPWANPGNTAGEFFSTEIRRDSGASGNSHCVVSRSTDNGASFSLFFERIKAVFQDRDMVDVDKTTARGGGTGTTHDGKVYLCYDDYGAGMSGFVGSFLQVISAVGSALTEIQVSGTGSPPFQGSQFQPVASVTDGQVYLLSLAITGSPPGAQTVAEFHEITSGGAGPNTFVKSMLVFDTAGQQLAASGRWGVNGARFDDHGYLDIDRSSGARRGYLYYISNRNPNPGNSALDQGDIYLSVSVDGATSWTSAALPTAASKTQYFPMLDVDDQGWIHVAYYQNESGSTNGGVLNANAAKVYYMLSTDGGATWSTPVQANAAANTLDLEDPPLDHSANEYYLYGDYQHVQATGTGATTKAYVLWSGYDKDRSDSFVNDKKDRVLCTTLTNVDPSGPVCGNGSIAGGETCDDGNTTSGDGCSNSCQVEACFSCTGAPSTCTPITTCTNGDGCCPSGCNSGNDDDCVAVVPALSPLGWLVLAALLTLAGARSLRAQRSRAR